MSRVIAAFTQFFDGSGDPLASGFLKFLSSGTNNTLKNTYSDSAQTLANENPLQLDAEGRCPNCFGQGIYRVVLYNRNPVTGLPGELIASFDPVAAQADSGSSGTNFSEWDTATTYQVGSIVTRNGRYYKSITANNLGNDPEITPVEWEQISFISYWNQYVTYLEDDIAVYNNQIYVSLAGSNLNNQPDISPAFWSPPGSGTVLINWQESGTTFQPTLAGYNLGAVGNEVGTAYINDLGQFTETPAAAPTADYEISNKKYVDDMAALKMEWQGDWVPGTYAENDVVRDDNWTMIANTSTEDRPAPQPVGDAEYVRDLFSPPAFSSTSASESVLYIGQRYTFVPAFFVTAVRIYLPAGAAGMNVELWAVYNPTGSYRIINIYPGFVVDADQTGDWLNLPVGQHFVEENTIIDVIMVVRSPAAENTFTYNWDYIRANGDPLPGDIHHQSGGNVDQIRVHEQDTSLTDRTVDLDNIGPGSTMTMDSAGVTWEVLEASKTGDVYTFIVDPGARSGAATSDFTFIYFAASAIPYVYNTNLYAADARINGYFGNIYDPDNATYINDNGYGVDIQIQNAIVSSDWDVVAEPGGSSSTSSDASSVGGYTPDEIAILAENETVTGTWTFDNEIAVNGVSSADWLLATDSPTITGDWDFTGALTKNSELVYSAENGPLAGFRNKIINGNFDIWQRNTTQASTTNGYGSDDRYSNEYAGDTRTVTQQSFTLGQTDVPGEPEFFSRTTITAIGGTAGSATVKKYKIEDVRTFAGQTATLSFYAKADSAKDMAVEFLQNFGTGGTPSAAVAEIGVTTHNLTTSWQKFIQTVAMPSISGKTLGTTINNYLELRFWFSAGSGFSANTNSLANQTGTFDIAQIQLEPGPDATPFEQRQEAIEQILCERYFEKSYRKGVAPGTSDSRGLALVATRVTSTGTAQSIAIEFKTKKRYHVPTITTYRRDGSATNPDYWRVNLSTYRATTVGTTSDTNFLISATGLTGTAEDCVTLDGHWTADAEL